MLKYPFATIGIILALIGIGVAASGQFVLTPPPEKSITTKVLEKGAEIVGLKNQAKPARNNQRIVQYTHIGFGLAALALTLVAIFKQEYSRITGMAMALSIVAIAWQYVMIGLVVAIVIYAILQMDFDIF